MTPLLFSIINAVTVVSVRAADTHIHNQTATYIDACLLWSATRFRFPIISGKGMAFYDLHTATCEEAFF